MVAGKQICVLTNVCKSDLAIYKLEPANDTVASNTNCPGGEVAAQATLQFNDRKYLAVVHATGIYLSSSNKRPISRTTLPLNSPKLGGKIQLC